MATENLQREDIQREIYALQRILDQGDQGRILIELEEARQKALAEQFGAETALNATLAKAQLLGLFPAAPEPPGFEIRDELPGERPLQPDRARGTRVQRYMCDAYTFRVAGALFLSGTMLTRSSPAEREATMAPPFRTPTEGIIVTIEKRVGSPPGGKEGFGGLG